MDIFTTLSKYAIRADENYLSEAFVYVIEQLLVREPEKGKEFVQWIFGSKIELNPGESASIIIRTQVTGEEGRPDIEVLVSDHFRGYVEVKHGASLGTNQLERYHADLLRHDEQIKKLILLTRSRLEAPKTTLSNDKYIHVRWYEIYNWLEGIQTDDEVLRFLIRSLNEFLEVIGMSMKKVTWEYVQGVPALLNITKLTETALRTGLPEIALRRTAGWSWRGFRLLNTGIWCGIRYRLPMELAFENNNGNNPTFRRAFKLEENHFFSLTKDEQFESLLGFVRDAYQDAVLSEEVTFSNELEDDTSN